MISRKPPRDSKENIDMSKETTDVKYPMVDLLTGATMSLMYLNVLAASNLLFLSAPWVCMEDWIKALEGGSVAALEQKEPLSDNRQIGQIPSRRPR
jgi:hypothetical protein